MPNSSENIIKAIIISKSGKEFQQLFWDIARCHYGDLSMPKMQSDLGNDGYSIKERVFFAVYAVESKYDNKETVKKISNPHPKKGEELGDYEKFVANWKSQFKFEKWIFVTKDDLMGLPHQKIVELNSNGDGIIKEPWGLQHLVALAMKLKPDDKDRIFGLGGLGETQAGEVETIMELICYITDNADPDAEMTDDIPDPDRKLERFSDYCNQIKREIVDSAMYAVAQKEAEEAVGLDTIRTKNKVAYLKRISRRFLRESANNPIAALDKITDYFEEKLRMTRKKFSHTAIRYYLISEIPKCNVFPNEYE